jgi:hypothetical protein
MIYFQALSQHLTEEISANHENVWVMDPISETRLENRTSRCWSRNSNYWTETLDVYMEMKEIVKVHWYILLRHMWGSNVFRLHSHVTTTKEFRMRWHHKEIFTMKAFWLVITHLIVPYVRLWNGVDIIKVLWNMATGRLVNSYRNLRGACCFHLQGLGNNKL